jgi:luciferase family oxidoreductase group 1
LPFSFAGHFSPEGMAAMRLYRHLFKPSEILEKPYAMIGVPVIAADTDEQARFQSSTQEQKFLSLVRGRRLQLQPPVADMSKVWDEWEKAAVLQRLGASIVGGPETVKRELEALIARTEADEVMIVSDFYEPADRLRSYEIVASLKQSAAPRAEPEASTVAR